MGLIYGYRFVIAPLFPASCRYNPSCSAYGLEAVHRFGAVKGSWLALRRILCCHPWGDHGFDPVPRRWPGVFGARTNPEARQ
jgi:putative membrane protein insertion efficiency factor